MEARVEEMRGERKWKKKTGLLLYHQVHKELPPLEHLVCVQAGKSKVSKMQPP